MKHFDWDEFKSLALKAERGICFEDVLIAIDDGRIIDDVAHPNQDKYSHQRILIIEVYEYVYLVPYVEDDEKIFFKTIIPSRKATRKYLRLEGDS